MYAPDFSPASPSTLPSQLSTVDPQLLVYFVPASDHLNRTSPPKSLRRHHDCNGRNHRLRHLHQSVRSSPTRPHPIPDPRCLDPRRHPSPAGRSHLGRTSHTHAQRRRPISLSPRGLPSQHRLPLRLGPAPRHADRRHGRGSCNLRQIFSRNQRLSSQRRRHSRHRPPRPDRHQLFRRPRRQQRPKPAHATQSRSNHSDGRARPVPRRQSNAPSAAPRPPDLPRPSRSHGRRHDPHRLRLRWLANLHLRSWRNARPTP